MVLKAHRWNALLLLVFVALHLGSHLFSPMGPAAHDGVLRAVRGVYRNPVVEPLLLALLLAQIALGLTLVVRRVRSGGVSRWGMIQIASGLYIALFLVAHAASALFARHANDLDTNFWWPASTLAHPRLRYFFYPYYFFGVVAVSAHLAAAVHFRRGSAVSSRALLTAGPIVALVALAGFGGWFQPLAVPSAYMKAFETYVPGVGQGVGERAR